MSTHREKDTKVLDGSLMPFMTIAGRIGWPTLSPRRQPQPNGTPGKAARKAKRNAQKRARRANRHNKR